MDRPTTEPSATEQPATEQSATLTDEELQEVAAGTDFQGNPSGFSTPRSTQSLWDSDDSIVDGGMS